MVQANRWGIAALQASNKLTIVDIINLANELDLLAINEGLKPLSVMSRPGPRNLRGHTLRKGIPAVIAIRMAVSGAFSFVSRPGTRGRVRARSSVPSYLPASRAVSR